MVRRHLQLAPRPDPRPVAGPSTHLRSYLRDLASLLPWPGHRSPDIVVPLAVQTLIFVKVLVAGSSTADLVGMVMTALMLLVIHVRTVRERVRLRAEADGAAIREAALQAELAEANTDHLTGLSTRRFIYRYLDSAAPDTAVTVAFADADGLKAINDRLGHRAGDDHLAAIAGRLSAASLPGDTLVRLGGDEFALATTRTPDQLAAALTRVLDTPIVIADVLTHLGVSVGIARTAGGDAHTALGCAEAAMRTAKRHHSLIEHYNANRDGTPQPPGIRPAIRPRDQQPDTTTTS